MSRTGNLFVEYDDLVCVVWCHMISLSLSADSLLFLHPTSLFCKRTATGILFLIPSSSAGNNVRVVYFTFVFTRIVFHGVGSIYIPIDIVSVNYFNIYYC